MSGSKQFCFLTGINGNEACRPGFRFVGLFCWWLNPALEVGSFTDCQFDTLVFFGKLSRSWFKYQLNKGPTKPTSPGNGWCTNPGASSDSGLRLCLTWIFVTFSLTMMEGAVQLWDFFVSQNFGDVAVDISQNSLQMVKVVAEITPPSGYVFQTVTQQMIFCYLEGHFFLDLQGPSFWLAGYGKLE